MADIHLYRARLFYKVTPYPWVDSVWRTNPGNATTGNGVRPIIAATAGTAASSSTADIPDGPERTAADDLADARRLIEQCGYWRRKEELEDAERAILGSAHQ